MKLLSFNAPRISRYLLPVAAMACLITTGCTARVYAPPPPGAYASSLLREADQRGMHAGYDDSARDAANRYGYHPRRDRKYADTPGYDPSMGPRHIYRDAFRSAYLRGYANGFNHR